MHTDLAPLQWTPWLLSLVAATLVWFPRLANAARATLTCSLIVAWIFGQIDYRALGAVAALGIAGSLVQGGPSGAVRAAGHTLFMAVGIALALHAFPGFHNPLVMGPAPLTTDATPFSLYLNLDKPLAGFWLMLMGLPRLGAAPGMGGARRFAAVAVCTAGACTAFAFATGMVAWTPKWPDRAWVWLINNLLLVAMTEEAFFRGYVQPALEIAATRLRLPALAGLLLAAFLFGLAHAAGGPLWVALASLAGIGYGCAYRFGGLRASVLLHFGINLMHFTLLTYPSLAAQR